MACGSCTSVVLQMASRESEEALLEYLRERKAKGLPQYVCEQFRSEEDAIEAAVRELRFDFCQFSIFSLYDSVATSRLDSLAEGKRPKLWREGFKTVRRTIKIALEEGLLDPSAQKQAHGNYLVRHLISRVDSLKNFDPIPFLNDLVAVGKFNMNKRTAFGGKEDHSTLATPLWVIAKTSKEYEASGDLSMKAVCEQLALHAIKNLGADPNLQASAIFPEIGCCSMSVLGLFYRDTDTTFLEALFDAGAELVVPDSKFPLSPSPIRKNQPLQTLLEGICFRGVDFESVIDRLALILKVLQRQWEGREDDLRTLLAPCQQESPHNTIFSHLFRVAQKYKLEIDDIAGLVEQYCPCLLTIDKYLPCSSVVYLWGIRRGNEEEYRNRTRSTLRLLYRIAMTSQSKFLELLKDTHGASVKSNKNYHSWGTYSADLKSWCSRSTMAWRWLTRDQGEKISLFEVLADQQLQQRGTKLWTKNENYHRSLPIGWTRVISPLTHFKPSKAVRDNYDAAVEAVQSFIANTQERNSKTGNEEQYICTFIARLYPAERAATAKYHFCIVTSFSGLLIEEITDASLRRDSMLKWLLFLESILTGFSAKKVCDVMSKLQYFPLAYADIVMDNNQINVLEMLDRLPVSNSEMHLQTSRSKAMDQYLFRISLMIRNAVNNTPPLLFYRPDIQLQLPKNSVEYQVAKFVTDELNRVKGM